MASVTQDQAQLNWNALATTNVDNGQFVKYIIQNDKAGTKVAYESTDIASLYELQNLETATEYSTSIKLVTQDFGESEYTAPITIKTLPLKLSSIVPKINPTTYLLIT